MRDIDLQQSLERVVQLQKSDRLPEAEQTCRAILDAFPDNLPALCLLAGIVRRSGQNQSAVDLLTAAANLEPGSAAIQFNLANALRDLGKKELALDAYRHAIGLDPALAQAHTNLANVLKEMGRVQEAIASYRIAVALRPDHAQSHSNLGVALTITGDTDEAIAACRRAIELKPDFPEGHCNLGNALGKTGQNVDAKQAFVNAIRLRPDYAQAYLDLGGLMHQMHDLEAALDATRKAVALLPDSPGALSQLGRILAEKNEPQAAIATFEKALGLDPHSSDIYCNLGAVLKNQGSLDDSVNASQRAIGLNPQTAEVYCNLGSALKDMGQIDKAIDACRTAVELNPVDAAMHSSLVGILHYDARFSARAIADELVSWNQRHALPLAGRYRQFGNDPSPDRRLRIGYVSPDFRSHVVGRNLLPLFKNHDHSNFFVMCYAQVRNPDAMTTQYQRLSDGWRNIVGKSDAEVADQVYADQIDILVDLALHTADNRLLVFARKPAPVQMTFAGYPGSTGLSAIDYRISDPWLDPADRDATLYSEKTLLLPHSFWCFDPLENFDVTVNAPPRVDNGYVTFGCLNNFGKTSPDLFRLWARVLTEVKNSKLLMLAPVGSHRERAIELFASLGIAAGRIEFLSGGSVRSYLELYHRIDICLDTFPYNGHSTSLDALWMGVPVVSLLGDNIVSRAGLSQLSNLGLPELCARSDDEFVEISVRLASDLAKTTALRSILREKMQASPLMDQHQFAANIEHLYRRAWRNWCKAKN